MSDADFRDLIWYLLNPPGDNRAWTPALRRELFGDENAGRRRAAVTPPIDMESVALWNPDWRVLCPPFEGAPAKQSEFQGRRNVLMTHPVDQTTPSAILRTLAVPAGGATLRFGVAAHERGDWELRVFAGRELLQKQLVDRAGGTWKEITIDLKRFAGQSVDIRLENAANGWNFEFGYWSAIEVTPLTGTAAVR
jgi:hypothetical protein